MDSSFYQGKRQTFYTSLTESSVFVLFSNTLVHRTADDHYRFFANRNFVYLTGVDEPDCILMAYRLHGEIEEILFIRDHDPIAEIRGGRRISRESACLKSGIANVQPSSGFQQAFRRIAGNCYFAELHLILEANIGQEQVDKNHLFLRTVKELYPNLAIKNAFPQLAWQRTLKSPDELSTMKKALAITGEGIIRMMQAARTASNEMDLYAEFMRTLYAHGILEPAFKPIVSNGSNNFFLHYDTPASDLQDGQLCLTDVGAILDFCCVDISRVFPRNGRFSEQQKSVYEIALQVNDEITQSIKPGMAFAEIDRLCRERTFAGLRDIGLLQDISDIGKYVWHGCTHHIGFDVHDVGTYHVPIEPNMVFTMDTGIYIREWNIGLRIEDNVWVTTDGLQRLSDAIPRSIEDIESIMS